MQETKNKTELDLPLSDFVYNLLRARRAKRKDYEIDDTDGRRRFNQHMFLLRRKARSLGRTLPGRLE